MFGNSYLYDPSLQLALENFSKVVHKIFENSSALMNFPPKLAKLLNLRLWSEFEANVTKVLQQGNDIIDEFMKQSTSEDDGLYAKLKEAEVPLLVIKRIFVDLVIAAGDTVSEIFICSSYILFSSFMCVSVYNYALKCLKRFFICTFFSFFMRIYRLSSIVKNCCVSSTII